MLVYKQLLPKLHLFERDPRVKVDLRKSESSVEIADVAVVTGGRMTRYCCLFAIEAQLMAIGLMTCPLRSCGDWTWVADLLVSMANHIGG